MEKMRKENQRAMWAMLKGIPKSDVEVVVKREGKGNLTFKPKREKIKEQRGGGRESGHSWLH